MFNTLASRKFELNPKPFPEDNSARELINKKSLILYILYKQLNNS